MEGERARCAALGSCREREGEPGGRGQDQEGAVGHVGPEVSWGFGPGGQRNFLPSPSEGSRREFHGLPGGRGVAS